MDKKIVKFDYKSVLELLDKVNKDTKGVDIKDYHSLCRAFVQFSASMGSLIAWGFEGKLIQKDF